MGNTPLKHYPGLRVFVAAREKFIADETGRPEWNLPAEHTYAGPLSSPPGKSPSSGPQGEQPHPSPVPPRRPETSALARVPPLSWLLRDPKGRG